MEPIIEDFVNRSVELTSLWDMALQKAGTRILVVEAGDGMGKTYLLDEFRAECQDKDIEAVSLDFEKRKDEAEYQYDPGYAYVIKETWEQLGYEGFELLSQTIQSAMATELRSYGQAGWQALQSERQSVPETKQERPAPAAAAGPPPGGQSGGVNVDGHGHILQDVAGRDLIKFIQVIHQEHPKVQAWARIEVTDAFQKCLAQVTAKRKVVFFIDQWHKTGEATHRWLNNSLVKWTARGLLPQACIVIAGLEGTDLDPRRQLKRIPLPELDEAAIQLYLVDKNGLPPDEVPGFIKFVGGIPLALKMATKRWQRHG